MTPAARKLHAPAPGLAGQCGAVHVSPARGRPAFTLVELLVVIGVIVVLTSMMLPAIKGLSQDNSRKQAANQIRAYFARARSIAISQHRQAGVVFFDETPQYAAPVHGGQTAIQLIVEDFNQAQYNPIAGNTVFVEFSPARDYLPGNVRLAVLNDDPARGVTTGDEASASTGSSRAVLFDASGAMIARHGIARPDLGAAHTPGQYPYTRGDWQLTKPRSAASLGVSSPGVILYDYSEYLAQNIPADHSGDGARNNWIKQHADVILVNTNTGAILE